MSAWDLVEEKLNNLEERQNKILEMLSNIGKEPTVKIYDNSDVVRLLHVSDKTLASWRAEGKISFSRVGSKFYYTQNDLDEFLVKNKVKSINNN